KLAERPDAKHREGRRFDSDILHQTADELCGFLFNISFCNLMVLLMSYAVSSLL
ncbi:MAG: hypothetical protein RL131_488, partial [Bacteroidota bacterium]